MYRVQGADEKGKAVARKQLKRAQMLPFFAHLLPCRATLKACGSAHYWARKLMALGHTDKLVAPQYVKLFVKRNKHDVADAEVISKGSPRDQTCRYRSRAPSSRRP